MPTSRRLQEAGARDIGNVSVCCCCRRRRRTAINVRARGNLGFLAANANTAYPANVALLFDPRLLGLGLVGLALGSG